MKQITTKGRRSTGHGKQDHVRCIIILLLRALMAIKINIHYENNKAYLNNKMRIIKSS